MVKPDDPAGEILVRLTIARNRFAAFARFMVMNPMRHARKASLAALLAVSALLLPNVAAAQIAPSPDQHVLPDPVPNRGADYPPSAATATTAYAGPPIMALHNACTEYNPCATSSPAPHGPRIGALARKRASKG